jgi:hypothetical protein
MESRDLLDRQETADALGITMQQYVKLTHNPTFPKPVYTDRTTVYRDREQVEAFKQQLEAARQRGWKVPEALYAWE